MNILLPHSWLKDYLQTNLPAKKIGRLMSLCGPSVERTTKVGRDWRYDIEITTNRPDTASVVGIAREAAAILKQAGNQAQFIPPRVQKTALPTRSALLKVTIDPPSVCPRFTAVVLDQVTIGPSPKLIRDRLETCGLRPLNNIVDLGNYLMLETGQPIHTFDYDKIGGRRMKVRLSRKGEKVVTLDGVKRLLPGGDIVIEDGQNRLIDLCGIMGAENSAIDPQTKRVLLFVQSYDPVLIRRTSMRLAHRTEAAIRFERGVDEEGIMAVVWQGIKLAGQTAGAKPASKIYDFYSAPYREKKVTTTQAFINTRLGVEISTDKIVAILSSLGFKTAKSENKITATVPSWRKNDVRLQEDLVEEVARIYGYHNLPANLPPLCQPPTRRTQALDQETEIKHFLKNWGFTEVYNYSLVSDELASISRIPIDNRVRLANPMSEEWVWLRPSLIPSLLMNLVHNQSRFPEMKIFEMANTYRKKIHALPEEQLILAGAVVPGHFNKVKGLVLQLCTELGIHTPTLRRAKLHYLDPQKAVMLAAETDLGWFGQLHPLLQKKVGLKENVFLFQLKVDRLKNQSSRVKTFLPISAYPPVIEDLTFVFPPQTPLGEVIDTILTLNPLISTVEPTSSFRNAQTLRVTYLSQDENLSTAKVTKIRQAVLAEAKKKFGLVLKK